MEGNNFNQNNFSENQNEQYREEKPQSTRAEERNEKKSIGPIIGMVIILVIIIFGGLYYWGGQIKNQKEQENVTSEEILEQKDPALEALEIQNSSNEIKDIEVDLDLTNLEGLDKELENIDAEINI